MARSRDHDNREHCAALDRALDHAESQMERALREQEDSQRQIEELNESIENASDPAEKARLIRQRTIARTLLVNADYAIRSLGERISELMNDYRLSRCPQRPTVPRD